MNGIITKLYEGWCGALGRKPKVIYSQLGKGSYESLKALLVKAQHLGYACGPIDFPHPIALFKGAKRVGKWHTLSPKSLQRLDGFVVSDNYQNGTVVMVELQKGQA